MAAVIKRWLPFFIMSVIKFRVWDNHCKEMILPEQNLEIKICNGKLIHISHKKDEYSWYASAGEYLNLDRYILQQYTGLKDENKKEIFEGDIIIFMGRWDKDGYVLEPDYEPYQVVWHMGGLVAWKIKVDSSRSYYVHNDVCGVGHTNSRVIGNVFENPEYLK